MRAFGHVRPRRDEGGNIISYEASPVQARTRAPLGPSFGPDRKFRLIVTLAEADVIVLRPERCGEERARRITAQELYRYLLSL